MESDDFVILIYFKKEKQSKQEPDLMYRLVFKTHSYLQTEKVTVEEKKNFISWRPCFLSITIHRLVCIGCSLFSFISVHFEAMPLYVPKAFGLTVKESLCKAICRIFIVWCEDITRITCFKVTDKIFNN